MQKLFYGVHALLEINPRTHMFNYMIRKDDKYTRKLDDEWCKDFRLDRLNNQIADSLLMYSKGICFKNQYNLIAAFLKIKPLQTIGFEVSDKSIISYWLKINMKSDTAKLILMSKNFIIELHKSKMRFRNQHLILALFSGHFENWLKLQLNK